MPPWLTRLPECPSTNAWALARAAELGHGDCVWTDRQTAGRGRDGRAWHSPPGVLTASFALRLAAGDARLAPAAGLAVAHAVEDHAPGLAVGLKWPNDVVLAGGKLAGVLCERASAQPGVAVVGVGLNLDPRWELCPEALPLAAGRGYRPASLAEHGVAPPAPEAMLASLRRYLLEAAGMLAAGAWPALLAQLRTRDVLRGRELEIDRGGGVGLRGRGAGLDDQARLLVDDGRTVAAVASGHVARW